VFNVVTTKENDEKAFSDYSDHRDGGLHVEDNPVDDEQLG
jgi:hypothetical protein